MKTLPELYFFSIITPNKVWITNRSRVASDMFSFRRLGHAKSSFFSTISLAALLFLLLLVVSIFCNLCIHVVAVNDKTAPSSKVRQRIRSNLMLSVKEEAYVENQVPSVKEAYVENQVPLVKEEVKEEAYVENQAPLVAPFNVTEEERIAWFKEKLPEFRIFQSTKQTRQFAKRVDKFFDTECEVRVFMTWISPAKSFGQRELLALESLFKTHPNGCLVIISRTMDSENGNQILKPVVEKGFKVVAVAPDLSFLFKGTPAEAWFDELKKGSKDPGEIPLAQNLSNLLRLAALYKYGGIYLDTDFILLKKLSNLRNTIGAQSMDAENKNWTRLNNAVLIFDKNHPLVYKFIEEFALTFDGNKWGHNGPYLVSRVVERVKERAGFNLTVLPPMAFYPVDWNKIHGLFRKPKNHAESRWVTAKLVQLGGETYGVHLWNKQSSRLRIEEGSIMGKLISDHCVLCEQIYSS